VITSKPRHDQPIGEIRDGMVYPTRQFQRWIDDVTSQIEEIERKIQDIDDRLTAIE
jgi:predicted transcriptional regulator